MRVLLIAYEGRVKGEEKPFDRVEEERPLLVFVGKGELIKGLEEALEGMKVGEEREIEIPPEKAFGERKAELIAIIPEREFRKRGITPYPGLVIEADGRRGRVLSVSGGRVQVDFNHELAGKTVVYKVKVIKEVKENTEIARHLFLRYFGREPENVEEKDGILTVEYVPKDLEKDTVAKAAFVGRRLANTDIKAIRMVEIYRQGSS